MNVPLRVTELRMALMRKRAFEAAMGRLAPSLRPHKPPIASPNLNMSAHCTMRLAQIEERQ